MSSRRNQRVHSIVDYLRNRGPTPSSDIFSAFPDFKERTFWRDIDYMRDELRYQIDGGKNGLHLKTVPKERSIKLFPKEIFNLAIVQKLVEFYENTPMEVDFNLSLSKITESFGAEYFVSPESLKNKLFIKGFGELKMDSKIWESIFWATLKENKVKVHMRSAKSPEQIYQRVIHCYALVHQGQGWYVLAKDEKDEKIKSFALWRVDQAEILEEQYFDSPPSKEVRERIESSSHIDSSEEVFQVKLRFNPTATPFIEERVWFKDQIITKEPDGYLLLSFNTTGKFSVYNFVLQQGSSVEVVEPLFVREEVIRIYKRALNVYGL